MKWKVVARDGTKYGIDDANDDCVVLQIGLELADRIVLEHNAVEIMVRREWWFEKTNFDQFGNPLPQEMYSVLGLGIYVFENKDMPKLSLCPFEALIQADQWLTEKESA